MAFTVPYSPGMNILPFTRPFPRIVQSSRSRPFPFLSPNNKTSKHAFLEGGRGAFGPGRPKPIYASHTRLPVLRFLLVGVVAKSRFIDDYRSSNFAGVNTPNYKRSNFVFL